MLTTIKNYGRSLVDTISFAGDMIKGGFGYASKVSDLKEEIRETPVDSPSRASLRSQLKLLRQEY